MNVIPVKKFLSDFRLTFFFAQPNFEGPLFSGWRAGLEARAGGYSPHCPPVNPGLTIRVLIILSSEASLKLSFNFEMDDKVWLMN